MEQIWNGMEQFFASFLRWGAFPALSERPFNREMARAEARGLTIAPLSPAMLELRGSSSMVEPVPSKHATWVRFPSPAPGTRRDSRPSRRSARPASEEALPC